MEEIIKEIEKRFFEGLSEKTGWGRNDIKDLYRFSVNNTLLKYIEKNQFYEIPIYMNFHVKDKA
jgi:hypothetical protein